MRSQTRASRKVAATTSRVSLELSTPVNRLRVSEYMSTFRRQPYLVVGGLR